MCVGMYAFVCVYIFFFCLKERKPRTKQNISSVKDDVGECYIFDCQLGILGWFARQSPL